MMKKSLFEITHMDCPSEENLIRMKLGEVSGIRHLDFDLSARRLTVHHEGPEATLEAALESLQLGRRRLWTEHSRQTAFSENRQKERMQWNVWLIYFGFFVIEISNDLLSRSMDLVADSRDRPADIF